MPALRAGVTTVNVKNKDFTWTRPSCLPPTETVLALNDGNADIFPGPNFLGQNYIIRVGQPIGSFYGMTRLGTYSEGSDGSSYP